MDQTQLEKLSALMDDDGPGTTPAGFLDRLSSEDDLSARWQRYHLIGDVLRKETVAIDHALLTASIRKRIADEPPLLAPGNLRGGSHSWHGWPQWAAGMAVAASVAALVVVGVTQLEQRPGGGDIISVTESQPKAETAVATAPKAPPRPAADAQQVASKINRYLADHSRFVASGGSLNGMVPLATLVSHDE